MSLPLLLSSVLMLSSRQYEFGCLRNLTLSLAVLEILLHWHLPEPDFLFVFNMGGVVPKVNVPRCDCRFPLSSSWTICICGPILEREGRASYRVDHHNLSRGSMSLT